MEHESVSLDEAIGQFNAQLGEGVTCPCCGRFGKIYKHKLNTGMARILIDLVKMKRGDEFIDIRILKSFVPGSGDYAYLRFWGLIEQAPNNLISKRSSGLWRATEKGIAFARGQIQVPSHIFVFDNQPEGFSDTLTDIQTALGERFDYRELMSA